MRVLQMLSAGWRCTIEEQDDPALWIAHALRGAGAGLGVVLCGSAVGYATEGLDATGLRFGDREQRHPPRLDRDVAALVEKGVPVWVLEEDCRRLGIEPRACLSGVQTLPRAELASLCEHFDQIWRW